MRSALYTVPLTNLHRLKASLESLSARAVKLGLAAFVLTEGRHFEKVVQVGTVRRALPHVEVTLEGERPKLNGWSFVASLRHLVDDTGAEVSLISRPVFAADIDLPERFRTASASNCDHCQRRVSNRTSTYVLHHDTEGFRQVGSTCLQDFLGHQCPHALAAALELLLEAVELLAGAAGEGWEGEGTPSYFSLREYLAFCASHMRRFGWRSRTQWQESSTADGAFMEMFPAKHQPARVEPTDVDCALAEQALEWAKALRSRERLSDYLWGVWTVSQQVGMDTKMMGVAASLVRAFVTERQAQTSSRHMGVEKERLELVATCQGAPTHLMGAFPAFLYRFLTADGCVLTWKSSQLVKAVVPGTPLRLLGTVKEHKVRNDVAETALTRVKVLGAAEVATA